MLNRIKCMCGREVPPLAVQAAVEVGNALQCARPKGCGAVIPHDVLVDLTSKPLARNGDPETSVEAARHMMSRLRETQMRALKFVRENPGRTANELAQIAGDRDTRKIGRRLPELAKMGLITRGEARPCAVTKTNAIIWNPVKVAAKM